MNHCIFQYLVLAVAYMVCAYIMGYEGVDPVPVGAIGASITYLFLVIILYTMNLRHWFEWWRHTYLISVFMTCLWIILITFVTYLGARHHGTVGDKEKKQILALAGSLSLSLILIEYTLVFCGQYWICKIYPLGYASTLRDPQLQQYLNGEISRPLIRNVLVSPGIPYITTYEHRSQDFSVDAMAQT